MQHSRREFVGAGLAGAASLYAARTLGAADLWNAPQQSPLANEDGYRLWLRYVPIPGAPAYRRSLGQLLIEGSSPTATVIRREMSAALSSMLGATLPDGSDGLRDGAIVVGTPDNSPAIKGLGWQGELAKMGAEGYVIRPARVGSRSVIAIASAGEVGSLYGAFHFLRLLQIDASLDKLDIAERPRVQLRLLNHWDNLDGTIERGYAGRSIWQWSELPGTISPRYIDYARANASDRHQRVGRQQRERRRARSLARVPRQGRGACGSVAPVWRPHVSVGERCRTPEARQAHDRRSARPGRRLVVEAEGRRDLQDHSRLRRVHREGQLRGATGPEGLRPHSCRGRQRPRRRSGSPRRQRRLARVHLRRRRRSRSGQARVHRVHEARWAIPPERAPAGEERRDRLHAARALSSACSARSRRPRCSPRFRRRRNIWGRRSTWCTSERCGRSSSRPIRSPKARDRRSPKRSKVRSTRIT